MYHVILAPSFSRIFCWTKYNMKRQREWSCCQCDHKRSTTTKHVFINYVYAERLSTMCLSAFGSVNKMVSVSTVTRNNDDMWIDDEAVTSMFSYVHMYSMQWVDVEHDSPHTILVVLLPFPIYYFIFCSICWFLFHRSEFHEITKFYLFLLYQALRKISNLFTYLFPFVRSFGFFFLFHFWRDKTFE